MVGILSWVAILVVAHGVPVRHRSRRRIAWINSVGNLGGHFGPDLIGRIRTATGGSSEAAFFTLAAVAFLGVLIILFLPGTQKAVAAPAVAK
jgi:hypothetical protein